MAKGPDDREIPSSPDEMPGGLRGRIGGVTRVGPRAFGIAFFIVCALLVAILYGVNKSSTKPTSEAFSSPPPAIETDEAHFGSNEPIVPTPPPATPPPPLILPPTSVPNLDNVSDHTATPAQAPAPPAAPSQEDQRLAQQQQADAQAERDAEKKRQDIIDAARKSPILTGNNSNAGNVSNPAAPGVQLSYAGNGGGETGSGGSSGAGGLSGGESSGGSGAGGGIASLGSGGGPSVGTSGNALVGRTVADNAGRTQAAPNAFLDGPTGQYRVTAASVDLPEGASAKDFLQAQRFAPLSPFEILASSVIPATLITGIDSEVPGLVSAQVREDVYDTKTGRYMLIPRGSRLVGVYKSDVSYGQSRLLIAWQRLIFPDTTSIDILGMPGADVQGGGGFGGDVDNHYGKIFGAALLTSILAAGLELATPQQQTLSVFQQPSASQTVSQAVAQQLSQTATSIVSKDLNIPPTIHVSRGYPFIVFVDRDMVLPGPYRPQ